MPAAAHSLPVAPGAADDPRAPGALPPFVPLRLPQLPYEDVRELLDDPAEATPRELRQSLRDIRMANLVGQGTAVVLRHLPDVLAGWPAGRTLHVLDLATGSGDIPRAVLRWCRRHGIACRITASDISPEVLEETARHTRGIAQ